ncbi:MAG: RagB/SusD family nutrient uptake outer membrane protein [Anditalea sp.]
MKKYVLIYLLFSSILISCEDLDRPPLDTITDKEMTFTKTEMELYANKYYGAFPGFSDKSFSLGIFEEDNSSDNLVSGDYGYDSQLAGTITVPSSGGGWNWSEIRSINFFLDNYHITTESPEVANPYIGEMYFWRAWHYYSLLKQFGDLPWYNKPLTTESEELFAPRISRSIIADSIIVDLDKAVELLPLIDRAIPGRIHKDVALLFQSRVALYEGSWEKYHNGSVFAVADADPSKYFRKSAEASQQIINNNAYSIEPVGNDPKWGYWRLFNQTDYSTNNEVLLWKKFDRSLDLFHMAQNYLGVSDKNSGLSKYLVESYLLQDGKPISVSPLYQGNNTVADEVQNRDPRLAQTMYQRDYARVILDGDTIGRFIVPDLTFESRLRNTTGYQMYKGVYPGADHALGDIGGSIIFRYAEALLNYAEAKAELNEIDQRVLDQTVNQLRDRVNMPHLTMDVGFTDPNWEFPNLSPLLNEIRRERRVELAVEGYRFDDLMRWAAAHLIKRPMLGAKMKQFSDIKDTFQPVLDPTAIPTDPEGYIAPHWNSPAQNGWQFDPNKHYLKPIPSNELVLNPSLEQNPGY